MLPASLLRRRQAGPGVFGADDPGDVLHQQPRWRYIGTHVQHHHQRYPLGRQIVRVDHVAQNVAVVAEPAVLVFERKPVESADAFTGRRQELVLLLLHGGRDQLACCEGGRPHAQVVERRDHVARRPAPGRIPVRRIEDRAVRHSKVAVGMRRRDLGSCRENRVSQPQRLQDVLLDEGRERLTGDLLDHQAEQDGVGVGIVEVAARRKQERMAE